MEHNHDHAQMNHGGHDHAMMDHSMMDHSSDDHNHGGGGGSGGGGADCSSMHNMIFHTSVCQHILFPGWTSTTAGEMVGACVVVFLAALLYEGLKYWREATLLRSAAAIMPSSQVNIAKTECGPNSNCSGQTVVKQSMMSLAHLIQTLMHVMQVLVSYLLMLIFMTYNVWLCIALLLGTGVGFFVFGWRKRSMVDLNEHCQ